MYLETSQNILKIIFYPENNPQYLVNISSVFSSLFLNYNNMTTNCRSLTKIDIA